jgi:hypothetical protein
MKTSKFYSGKNKAIFLISFFLLIISSSAFSQNKLVAIVSVVNFSFVLPVVGVICLATFLVTAFVKQKNR